MKDRPQLFPQPRQVITYDPASRSAAPTTTAHDPRLLSQGYELHVDADGVRLAHADDAGLIYGLDTIDQLREDGTVPHVGLRDWPDIAARGFMLDVSRSRVPTRETLTRLVTLLARARFTHLQLYVEHTVAYRGHESVWRDASPLSADDLCWLDDRCRERGIELVGNQNCFGHMERWLEVEEYRDRAECPDGWTRRDGSMMPPTVLEPTAENAEFVLDLVREQMSYLTSRTVNVGCDETFELGRGRSKAIVDERGVGAVYADHLNRILRPLIADGFRVQFWADVIRSHPEQLGRLPAEGTTAIAWNYEAPTGTFSNLDAHRAGLGIDAGPYASFERNAAPVAASGVPFWVAPGTSTWNSLVGRIDNARANVDDAIDYVARSGASGLLLTDWGDNGHLQPPSVSFPPIAYAGAVAWCRDANAAIDLAEVLDRYVFGDAAGIIGGVLERLGGLWNRTGRVAFNASPLQHALCPHQRLFCDGNTDVDAARAVVADIDAALDDLRAVDMSCRDAADVTDELTVAAGLARHGARRMLIAADADGSSRADLRHDLTALVAEHRRVWLQRSRPGGLDVSAAHLERTLALYD